MLHGNALRLFLEQPEDGCAGRCLTLWVGPRRGRASGVMPGCHAATKDHDDHHLRDQTGTGQQ